MKSLSVKLGVMIFGIGLIFACAEVWGADWKKYASDAKGDFYYDIKSVHLTPLGTLEVLVKWVFSEKGKIDNLREFGEEQQNVTHWLITYDYFCEHRKFFVSEITFWTDEKPSGETGPLRGEWKSFSRGSPGELLYKAICK